MELTPRQKLLLKSCPSLSVFEEFLNNYQSNNQNDNDEEENNKMTYSDSLTTDNDNFIIPSGANVSFGDNGMAIGKNSGNIYFKFPISKPCEIEYDVVSYLISPGDWGACKLFLQDETKTRDLFNLVGRIGLYGENANKFNFDFNNAQMNKGSPPIPEGSTVKIKVLTDSLELYVDDEYRINKEYSISSPFFIMFKCGKYDTLTIKNLEIREL